jgi:hypothetical protein
MPVKMQAADSLLKLAVKEIPQLQGVFNSSLNIPLGDLRRLAQSSYARDVFGAGPEAALMPRPEHYGQRFLALSHIKGPYPFRSVKLMACHSQHVHRVCLNLYLANRLCSIGMERNPAPVGHGCYLIDRLQGARLVV